MAAANDAAAIWSLESGPYRMYIHQRHKWVLICETGLGQKFGSVWDLYSAQAQRSLPAIFCQALWQPPERTLPV
jgi:hypothetical protein